MECRDAIDILAELTVGPPSNDEVVRAIDDFAIPAMMKEICRDVVVATSMVQYGREKYVCPNCGEFIKWRYDLEKPYWEPGRCPDCGQTLNWRIRHG